MLGSVPCTFCVTINSVLFVVTISSVLFRVTIIGVVFGATISGMVFGVTISSVLLFLRSVACCFILGNQRGVWCYDH